MFDRVRSSYPLLGEETDRELQCKDLDCVMGDYWISPAGQLFNIDYRRAVTYVEKPVVQRRHVWDRMKWEPNGEHGVVTPDFRTCMARLYGHLPGPEALVYFKHGLIRDVVIQP